jgi:hypothetical protein
MNHINPLQFQLLQSKPFWQQRCIDQHLYIQQIEQSDRTPDRRIELQLSALEVLRYCREQIRFIDWMNEIFSKVEKDLARQKDPYPLNFDIRIPIATGPVIQIDPSAT